MPEGSFHHATINIVLLSKLVDQVLGPFATTFYSSLNKEYHIFANRKYCAVKAQARPIALDETTQPSDEVCLDSFTVNLRAGERSVDPSHRRLWSVCSENPAGLHGMHADTYWGDLFTASQVYPSQGRAKYLKV